MEIKIECTTAEFAKLIRSCKAVYDSGFCLWCPIRDCCDWSGEIEHFVDVLLTGDGNDG